MIVLMCSKYLRRVRSERTFELVYPVIGAPQVGQWIKNPPAMQETRIQSLSGEGLLEEGTGRLSGIVSPFRAEQGTSLETPSRARASSCQAVGTTWFFSSCGHFFLEGIFLTQGLNLCLLYWQADSLPLSHLGSPDSPVRS